MHIYALFADAGERHIKGSLKKGRNNRCFLTGVGVWLNPDFGPQCHPPECITVHVHTSTMFGHTCSLNGFSLFLLLSKM